MEPQKDMAAHGGAVWPLRHHLNLPKGRLPLPSSPLPLVVTIGSICHRFGRDVQDNLLGPINSVAWAF